MGPLRVAWRAAGLSLVITGLTWVVWTPTMMHDMDHPPLAMWVVITLIGLAMMLTRGNRKPRG